MRLWLVPSIVALTALVACPPLFADALPPEALDCWAKKVGDACTDLATKQAGSCQNGTCSNNKFDAGPTVYECLTCSGAPPTDDGACTIGKEPTVKRVGPWLLAGMFSLLFLARRRRPR